LRGDLARLGHPWIVCSQHAEVLIDYALIRSRYRLDYSVKNCDFPIGPVTAYTLGACIHLCMDQGTQCMGASWVPETSNCFMKYFMQRGGDPPFTVHSVVRMSPAGGFSTQALENPGFDTGSLVPWETATQGNEQGGFSVSDAGVA